MNNTLEEFVKRSWVRRVDRKTGTVKKFRELTDKSKLYEEAGFKQHAVRIHEKARPHREAIQRSKTFNRLKGRIVLKRPHFREITTVKHFPVAKVGASIWGSLCVVLLSLSTYAAAINPVTREDGVVYYNPNPYFSWGFVINFVVGWLGWIILVHVASIKLGVNTDGKGTRFDGVKIDDNGTYLVQVPPEDYTAHVPEAVAREAVTLKREGFNPEVWFTASVKEIPQYTSETYRTPPVLDPILVGTRSGEEYAVLGAIWGEDIEDINKYFEKEVSDK